MKKRWLSLLLAIALVVGLVPTFSLSVHAADDVTTYQLVQTHDGKTWADEYPDVGYTCVDPMWSEKYEQWMCKCGGSSDYHTSLVNYADHFNVSTDTKAITTCTAFCDVPKNGENLVLVGKDTSNWATVPSPIFNFRNTSSILDLTYGALYINNLSPFSVMWLKHADVTWTEPAPFTRWLSLQTADCKITLAQNYVAVTGATSGGDLQLNICTVAQRDAVLPAVKLSNEAYHTYGHGQTAKYTWLCSSFDDETGAYLTDDEQMYILSNDGNGMSLNYWPYTSYYGSLYESVLAADNIELNKNSVKEFYFRTPLAEAASATTGSYVRTLISPRVNSDGSGQPHWDPETNILTYNTGTENGWKCSVIEQKVAENGYLQALVSYGKNSILHLKDDGSFDYLFMSVNETKKSAWYDRLAFIEDGAYYTIEGSSKSFLGAGGVQCKYVKIDTNEDGFIRLYYSVEDNPSVEVETT